MIRIQVGKEKFVEQKLRQYRKHFEDGSFQASRPLVPGVDELGIFELVLNILPMQIEVSLDGIPSELRGRVFETILFNAVHHSHSIGSPTVESILDHMNTGLSDYLKRQPASLRGTFILNIKGYKCWEPIRLLGSSVYLAKKSLTQLVGSKMDKYILEEQNYLQNPFRPPLFEVRLKSRDVSAGWRLASDVCSLIRFAFEKSPTLTMTSTYGVSARARVLVSPVYFSVLNRSICSVGVPLATSKQQSTSHINIDEYQDCIQRLKLFRSMPASHSLRHTFLQAILLYMESLDTVSPHDAFMRNWQVLERLALTTSSDGTNNI